MLLNKLHASIWLCNKQRKRPTDWVPIVLIVPLHWALIVLIVPPYTPPIDLLLHFCWTKIMVMFAEISNDITAAWNRHCTVNWGPDKISNEGNSDQRLREKVGLPFVDFPAVYFIWGEICSWFCQRCKKNNLNSTDAKLAPQKLTPNLLF